jgi:hypothetical protein
MRLQYLETLKLVGTSSSTKIVVPMDFVGGLLDSLGRATAGGGQPAEVDGGRPDAER